MEVLPTDDDEENNNEKNGRDDDDDDDGSGDDDENDNDHDTTMVMMMMLMMVMVLQVARFPAAASFSRLLFLRFSLCLSVYRVSRRHPPRGAGGEGGELRRRLRGFFDRKGGETAEKGRR